MKASPTYSPAVYTAVAMALSCLGNQDATTRLLVGKAGASATPIISRKPNSVAKLLPSPIAIVKTDHKKQETA